MERSKLSQRHTAVVTIIEGEEGLPISFDRKFKFKSLPEIAALGSRMTSGDPAAVLEIADFLAMVDLDWDLTEGGVKVPCTKEALLEESSDLVMAIFQEVMDKIAPKSGTTKSPPSDATSSTETP